ncbi:MAG: helix-hairpin-helix domain-containing protein [Ktedonobacteraceae bacterium]|nr:helix-hairpin-helix domain-containing protein [Ktedonobacteraceae bacterium]
MANKSSAQKNDGLIQQYFAHQQTMPYQAITPVLPEPVLNVPPFGVSDTYQSQALASIPEQALSPVQPEQPTPKLQIRKAIGVLLVCMLVGTVYVIWRGAPSPTATAINTTQQHFSLASTPSSFTTGATVSPGASGGKIQVYIVGAVNKPGIYTLEGNARIYELLQAAGGPLPHANLVALNLAARLSDGQEIYVTLIGETPPTSMSGSISTITTGTPGGTANQIDLNTASADDLRKGLHLSSTNAQAIISYRIQHGAYTSVQELLQVVSQATYKKIKDEVKV